MRHRVVHTHDDNEEEEEGEGLQVAHTPSKTMQIWPSGVGTGWQYQQALVGRWGVRRTRAWEEGRSERLEVMFL